MAEGTRSENAPAISAEAIGHPRGLQTLFFTEMWERLSFYGMRALLVLFMVDKVQHGGLGLTDGVATAIYGLYTAGVYLAALPGGWIADRLLGAQRAVWIGGILIAIGHFTLAIPRAEVFFVGLLLVVLGTGLLKPNISALVGQLYPEGGTRRDAGFTLFYMGINLGAALGPLVCSSLGEKLNWHYGFTAAGVGMVIGVVQFKLTRHRLGKIGLGDSSSALRRDWIIVWMGVAALAIFVALAMIGAISIDPVWLAKRTTVLIVAIAGVYFFWAFFFAGLEATEKRRLGVIAILFVTSALFWSGYEQAGSSLTLFAERHTQRMIPALNFEIPTGWFQTMSAVFVITLAPMVAWLWLRLARRGVAPSLPAKFAIGLLLLAGGFLVLALGAKKAVANGPVWPSWLVTTYLLHVMGELCVSPVGLSSVTKLAPPRLVGQMMGVWFLATSLGNLIAGLFAGEVSGDKIAAMPGRFMLVALSVGSIGLLLLFCSKPIRKLMAGVQ